MVGDRMDEPILLYCMAPLSRACSKGGKSARDMWPPTNGTKSIEHRSLNMLIMLQQSYHNGLLTAEGERMHSRRVLSLHKDQLEMPTLCHLHRTGLPNLQTAFVGLI